MKEGVSKLFFRHGKTQQACRIFLEWLKQHGCEVSPREMSVFTHDLQSGTIVKDFTYRRESFYRVILRRLQELGFIGKKVRYPNEIVYVPIIQPIPNRAPAQNTWWGLAYLIAEQWNQQFSQSV